MKVEKYRGIVDSEELHSSGSRTQSGDSDATMSERMRRLRGRYPREIVDSEPIETDEESGEK